MSAPDGAGRFTGARVLRREDLRLLTGRARYVADMTVAGMCHAAFVRSALARARITRVDVDAARRLDGVRAVFTADDLNGGQHEYWQTMLGPEAPYPPFRALADGDVRYVGEPIAVVIAADRYVAEDACDLVEVGYEPLPPVVGLDAATIEQHLVHPELGTNVASEIPGADDPDLDAAFAAAAHVVEHTVTQHRYLQVPMETRGLIAAWDPLTERLRIWASTQTPHEYRAFFARYLDIPEAHIHVSIGAVGGGFGQKVYVQREEMCVVLASRATGTPVSWIEDRRENLVAASSARADTAKVALAIDGDGIIRAARVEHREDVGAFPFPASGSAASLVGMVFTGPYKIGRLRFSNQALFTNTTGRGSYRGPWMMETVARETMIDIAARELGMDPLELRRRNIIRPDDLPYTLPTGAVFDAVTPLATLEQAVAMIDYDGFRRDQARARSEGHHLGIGTAVYIEPSAISFGMFAHEVATVRIETDGTVTLIMGSASHGQSVETTMSQIVADELGVGVDDIVFLQGDTALAPFNGGTGGSRSAVYCGGAARLAATRIRGKVLDVAGHLLEASPADLEVRDGVVAVRGTPARGVPLRTVAQTAYCATETLPPNVEPGLEVTARFQGPPLTWSNATHACTVEVDPMTGRTTILRYVVSEDCGPMINPMVVEGQIDGGVAQGIGGVLYEHMVHDDDGIPMTTTFLDYLLPTAAEVPVIEKGHVETPAPGNPGGFKGMGEGGAIGSPPALINAIADALAPLGVRITDQPLGPDAVLRLIHEAEHRP